MNTRRALESAGQNLEESMGVRQVDSSPHLSPVPKSKDMSRRPLRDYGAIEINAVVPDPDQPRTTFDDESIRQLAENMRAKGQLNPVRVRWSDDLGKWILVAGERRWRAAKEAGLESIDCYFHEHELTQSEILEESLIENLHREELTPIDEAKAYSMLMQINGWTGRQLAEAVSVHPTRVSRAVSLLKLPADVQEEVQNGVIPARSAYEISKLNNESQQRVLAQRAKAGRLTHDQAARLARKRSGIRTRSRGIKLTFLTEVGWRITVSNSRQCSYPEVEAALRDALEEVQHRIKNRVRLF